jgi:ABC-type lipoprotein release transport system permease subunit
MSTPNRQIARGSIRERHRRTRLAQILDLFARIVGVMFMLVNSKCGAAVAVVTARLATQYPATMSSRPASPCRTTLSLRIDLSIVAICVGLCLATSLVFGLLPAARFSNPAIISSLKDDAGVGGFRAGTMCAHH